MVEIVEEARSHVVGELIAGHKVRPLNKRLPDEIEVAGSLHGAKRGDWVKLKLLRGGEPGQEYRGTMVESLGKAGSIKTDLDAVVEGLLRLSQLTTDFPEIVEIDINPFLAFARGEGAIAVDARIVLKSDNPPAAH